MKKKQIRFIINPHAGVDKIKAISDAIDTIIDKEKFDTELVYTTRGGEGRDLAIQAVKDKIDILVAVGGDGSINDIVSGLIGSEVTLGIIPKGSGNGLARSLKIPLNLNKALALINGLQTQYIDIGKANDFYFASNAGVGFDACVTEEFRKSTKRGFVSYIQVITKLLGSYTPSTWEIEIEGKVIERDVFMLSAANAAQLGYNFTIAPDSSLDDGLLDIVIIKKFPALWSPTIVTYAFLKRLKDSEYVECYRTSSLILRNVDNKMMQVDGEFRKINEAIHISVLSKAIKVIVP